MIRLISSLSKILIWLWILHTRHLSLKCLVGLLILRLLSVHSLRKLRLRLHILLLERWILTLKLLLVRSQSLLRVCSELGLLRKCLLTITWLFGHFRLRYSLLSLIGPSFVFLDFYVPSFLTNYAFFSF